MTLDASERLQARAPRVLGRPGQDVPPRDRIEARLSRPETTPAERRAVRVFYRLQLVELERSLDTAEACDLLGDPEVSALREGALADLRLALVRIAREIRRDRVDGTIADRRAPSVTGAFATGLRGPPPPRLQKDETPALPGTDVSKTYGLTTPAKPLTRTGGGSLCL